MYSHDNKNEYPSFAEALRDLADKYEDLSDRQKKQGKNDYLALDVARAGIERLARQIRVELMRRRKDERKNKI